MRSFLANPRLATTTLPRSKLSISIPKRDKAVSIRMPDRGGFTPVGGLTVSLPNGEYGGIPRTPPPLLDGLQKMELPKVSMGTSKTLMLSIKKQINVQRLAEKPRLKIKPGLSALQIAIRGTGKSDLNTGTPLLRSGLRDIRIKSLIGTLSQNQTAPASTLNNLVQGRMLRNYGMGLSVLGPMRSIAGRQNSGPAPEPVSDSDIQQMGETPISIGNQPDFGDPPVRPAPQNQITASMFDTSGGGRLVFLLVVGALGFLMLRKG